MICQKLCFWCIIQDRDVPISILQALGRKSKKTHAHGNVNKKDPHLIYFQDFRSQSCYRPKSTTTCNFIKSEIVHLTMLLIIRYKCGLYILVLFS